MRIYRRILKIPWMDKVTIQEVLKRMSKETKLVKTAKQRKLQLLEHFMLNSKYEV